MKHQGYCKVTGADVNRVLVKDCFSTPGLKACVLVDVDVHFIRLLKERYPLGLSE